MKFLICADEHICFRRKHVPKDFEVARYTELFTKLIELSKSVDFVLHGGDMFDRSPTIDEVSLVVAYLNSVVVPTVIIDGNHEATKKGETFLPLLRSMVTNNLVYIIDEISEVEELDLTVVPYCKLKQFAAAPKCNTKYALTHVRGNIPPHVEAEIDLSVFSGFKAVFAGDLHDESCSQLNIIYPGSPLTTHFYRSEVKYKGVTIYDTSTDTYERINLHLPQLIKGDIEVEGALVVADVIPETVTLDTTGIIAKEQTRVEALRDVIPDDELFSKVSKLYMELCDGQAA